MEAFDMSKTGMWYNVYIHGDNSKTTWPFFNAALPQERHRRNQSLIHYAIVKNDMKMLQFLLKLGRDLMARKDGEETSKVFTIRDDDFTVAVKLGRTEMIGELIKVTGQAMPLNKMVASSGVNLEEEPRYYQGLSVYGKKRKDWAVRGQGQHTPAEESDEAPLLKTIFQGNLQTTEYYLSDGPLNRYQEFAKAHKDDKRIQGLAEAQGGIDKALGDWLGMRADLAIHMAVMAKPGETGSPLLEYVLKAMPEAIEAKSSSGLTPLHLAFSLGRIEAAKLLIAAGAAQTTRDDNGDNLLHTIFQENTLVDPKLLPSILGLLDAKLLQTLLLEKASKPDPGSMTPIAVYVNQFANDLAGYVCATNHSRALEGERP